MANWRRSLADALWALDRALGGQRPPTRIQKSVARHPIGTSLFIAVPFALFFWALAGADDPGDPFAAVVGGLAIELVFGLTAYSERLRQRRLKRLGLWNGS